MEPSKHPLAWPSCPITTKQTSLIAKAATEAAAVIEPQSEDPAGAEVVTVVTAETGSPSAHDEIVVIAKDAVTAGSEMTTAEEIVGTTGGADQAETVMIVETAHALETMTGDAASAHVVEAVAAKDETETVLERPVLRTEMETRLRPGNKQKSRSASKKRKNISLLRKKHERKAYRFQAGQIGVETLLLLRAAGTMIESPARLHCENEIPLVTEIEIGTEIGIVNAHPGREVDPVHLLQDVEVESRDLRVLSTSIAMFPAHLLIVPAQLGVQLGSVIGAEIGIGIETVIGTRTEIADMRGMMRSRDARAAHEAAVGDEIGQKPEVGAVVRM